MSTVMYDSITVAEIPASAAAVAGYVGGNWPTFAELQRRFPHAHQLSIAIDAEENADCLDVEPGDATPSEVAGWVARQHARGAQRPVIYASRDNVPEILSGLHGVPRNRYRIWSAHYGFGPHVCNSTTCHADFTADATQWTESAFGRNLDESLCADTFFPAPPTRHQARRQRIRRALPRRKVSAAGLGAGLSTAVFAYLSHHGVHLTGTEHQAISGAVAVIAGYLTPA